MSEDSPSVLSEREMEILRLVAQGLSNKEIARELFISANTVKVHLRNVFVKLEVSSRTEATMLAVRQGWVAVEMDSAEGEPAAGLAMGAFAALPATYAEPIAPLAPWQRLFLLTALTVVIVALVWTWPLPIPAGELPDNPLIDNPGPVVLEKPFNLSSRWQEEVPLSIARGRLAAIVAEGHIYAIGGETPGGITGAVEAYDPVRRAWTLKATKSVPVANVGGALLGDKIYVPGGLTFSGQVTDVMEVYDPDADRWAQAASLPAPRAAYALATYGEKLYLFGGTDGQRDVATVFVYDPMADEWQGGPSMPSARAFAGAAALNDRIYVVGGYAGESELDTCQVLLPTAGGWDSCAPLIEGRGGLSLIAVGRNLFAIGGGWEGYLAYSQQYDPARDIWLRFETPVSGQWRNAGAAEIDGKVYVIGGWSGEFLNANLAYQATYYNVFIPFLTTGSGEDGEGPVGNPTPP